MTDASQQKSYDFLIESNHHWLFRYSCKVWGGHELIGWDYAFTAASGMRKCRRMVWRYKYSPLRRLANRKSYLKKGKIE